MQSAAKRAREPHDDSLIELPVHSRLPRLDLGIEWESPSEVFRTSVRDFFAAPWPPRDSDTAGNGVLRVDWIRGRVPARALAASCVWHIAAVWILILPIWGFLPSAKSTLAPVQIELIWYAPPQDLPRISLPAAKRELRQSPNNDHAVARPPDEPRATDASHPRQTILSVPVHVTHPRQTLIEPDATPAPPKIAPALPNIVQWAATTPKLRMPLAQAASAPVLRQRATQNIAAPEIGNTDEHASPLNLASAPDPKLKLPTLSSSASKAAARHSKHADAGAAPEIGAATQGRVSSLPRLIALSATPAPPSPEVRVPEGNLAARIAVSPEGAKSGGQGGTSGTQGKGDSLAVNGGSISTGNKSGAPGMAGGAESLPAAISISGGSPRPGRGGITPVARLIPKPTASVEVGNASRHIPADLSTFDPSQPPEKILSDREVHTVHINLPNLTSASGSWILSFAQLDEDTRPQFRPKGALSGPVPVATADPEYPQDMIHEHVAGEVVLYAIIRKDGSVDSIQVVRSLEPELDRSATAALAQWKFRPGRRAGAPVDLEAVVHIPFNYKNPRE